MHRRLPLLVFLAVLPGLGCGSPNRAGTQGSGGTDGNPDAGILDDGGAAHAGSGGGSNAGFFPLRRSPIADENLQQGSGGWRLSALSRKLAAFADRTSYLPGEVVSIHAGAETATNATYQVWRLGYYGGAGGRKILDGAHVSIPIWQPAVLDPATGAVRAPWPTAFRFRVPAWAVTGVYLVRISAPSGQTYAMFVVREAVAGATVLYPVSTNTYQAYNLWGGTSLYFNRRSDWTPRHAYAVSFDRPYEIGGGAGELFGRDRDFITFAEGQGYDIAYVTDTDLDAAPELTARRRMIALQGHSEYWTAGMRDAAEAAIGRGTNAAFFAANNAYWQVRFADDSRRLLIGYKEFAALDPIASVDPVRTTTKWRSAPVNRPENAMIGEMYGSWIWTSTPLTVTDASSWVWTGAGVSANSIVPGVYSDEVDRRFDNGAQPVSTVIADSMVEGFDARLDTGETTIYTAPSGAEVFSAGSIQWSRALANAGNWDRRIQQLVANLFSRFAGDGTLGPAALQPLNLPPGPSRPSYRGGVQVATVTTALKRPVAVAAGPGGDALVVDQDQIVRVSGAGVVTAVAGGSPGYADGPAARAAFRGPRGLAVAPSGDVYVSDTGNDVIRVISNGTVRTLASGFSTPMGIALTPDGTLLVADSRNFRLCAVAATGAVSTWAGTGVNDVTNGPGASAALSYPFAVAVLPTGDAIIAEPAHGVMRKISAAAAHEVTNLIGGLGTEGWDDGPSASATVSETLALAARADGQLVFLDSATARVRAFRDGAVDTLAGGQRGGTVDGAGESAGFGWPRGIAVAADGSLLVVDAREHALRKVTLSR